MTRVYQLIIDVPDEWDDADDEDLLRDEIANACSDAGAALEEMINLSVRNEDVSSGEFSP